MKLNCKPIKEKAHKSFLCLPGVVDKIFIHTPLPDQVLGPVHPPGPGTPPQDQVHPPRLGTSPYVKLYSLQLRR